MGSMLILRHLHILAPCTTITRGEFLLFWWAWLIQVKSFVNTNIDIALDEGRLHIPNRPNDEPHPDHLNWAICLMPLLLMRLFLWKNMMRPYVAEYSTMLNESPATDSHKQGGRVRMGSEFLRRGDKYKKRTIKLKENDVTKAVLATCVA